EKDSRARIGLWTNLFCKPGGRIPVCQKEQGNCCHIERQTCPKDKDIRFLYPSLESYLRVGTGFVRSQEEQTMKKVVWLIIAVCAGLTEASAQQVSDLRVSVFGGGSFLSANRTFPVDGDVYNTKYESGPRFGFRATGSLTERVSIEGSYSYGRNN